MNRFKILAAAMTLAFTSPAFASDSKSPIIGAWRMTALEVGAAGNLQAIPYSGQLVFTQAGTLSVQAMNPDANAADTPYTTKAYEAYYGPVEIDDAKNIFAITVESSLVRNLIGPRGRELAHHPEDVGKLACIVLGLAGFELQTGEMGDLLDLVRSEAHRLGTGWSAAKGRQKYH